MIGRVNTGGGSGCILTITAVASETVTISKNGKPKSKTADSKGVAVFRGLDTGKWTITIVRGGVPITRVVAVTADYSVAIPLFAATINITYPAGSTCTCSDGTTTLSAPDTSGTWACIVPNAGTWTVTSTSGAETDSKAVTITTDGQSTSVELGYALYLFRPNDPCEDVTGGWNVDSNAESVTYGESLVIKSANYYNHDRSEGVLTKNQIDLTAYRTLQAICKADGGTSPALAVYTGSNAVASGAIGAELNVVTIDISALSGLHYIGFSARHAAYASVTYTATEIKLVK